MPQSGWVQTLPASGSYSVNLKNADVSGMDFGNKGNLSISGMKYYDLNGNGVQDKDEPGIPGQTVTLLESGKEIATTTTGQDGGYTFNNLVQGTYTINDPPSGGFVLTTTSSITVTVTTSLVLHASFGLTGTHSISGVKFNDVNGNGVMDSGERRSRMGDSAGRNHCILRDPHHPHHQHSLRRLVCLRPPRPWHVQDQ